VPRHQRVTPHGTRYRTGAARPCRRRLTVERLCQIPPRAARSNCTVRQRGCRAVPASGAAAVEASPLQVSCHRGGTARPPLPTPLEVLHPADNRPRLLSLTAIAGPTWVGLLVFAGVFLDTAWDATPALLPSAIGSRCVATTSWPTLPVGAQPTWSHAVLQTLVMPLCDLANRSVLSPRVFPRLLLTQPLCVRPAHPPVGVGVCNPFRAAPAGVFLCWCHGIHSLQPTDALARPAPRAWPRFTDGTCDGFFSGRHDGSGAEQPSSA